MSNYRDNIRQKYNNSFFSDIDVDALIAEFDNNDFVAPEIENPGILDLDVDGSAFPHYFPNESVTHTPNVSANPNGFLTDGSPPNGSANINDFLTDGSPPNGSANTNGFLNDGNSPNGSAHTNGFLTDGNYPNGSAIPPDNSLNDSANILGSPPNGSANIPAPAHDEDVLADLQIPDWLFTNVQSPPSFDTSNLTLIDLLPIQELDEEVNFQDFESALGGNIDDIQNDLDSAKSIMQYVKTDRKLVDHDPTDLFKRRTVTTTYRVSHELENKHDVWANEKDIDNFLKDMVSPFVNDPVAQERGDLISVEIRNPNINPPFYLAPISVKKFTDQDLFNAIGGMAQSNYKMFLTGDFIVKIRMVENTIGHGKRSGAPTTYSQHSKRKKSVIQIKATGNNYGMCGFFAITLAKLYADLGPNNTRVKCARTHETRLRREAEILSEEINFPFNRPLQVSDLSVLEDKLSDYELTIVCYRRNEFLNNPKNKREKKIILEHDDSGDGHWNVITTLKGS